MPKIVLQCCVVVALGALLSLGCGRKTLCNPDGTPSAASFAAHGEKPSEEEAKQFARILEKAVSGGNIAQANALVDWDTLLDFATDTAEGSDQFRKGFIKGAKQSIQDPASLMGQIVALVRKGGTYKFLRCHEQDGQRRVLFRLLSEGALNYHDLVVLKYPDSVRAADIYVAASGELLSKTTRQLFISALAAEKPSLLSKEDDHDADLAKNATKLKGMADAIRQGKPRMAIDIYAALPESVKGEKTVILLRIKAAQSLKDDAEYRKAMDDFQRRHPDDPCLDLINIDHYFLMKRYDKELAAIEHMETAIGGDAYLDVLRANTYFVQGKVDQALRSAQKASAAEKDMKAAYETELAIALSAEKFADVARLIEVLQRDFHVSVETLVEGPQYDDFRASKEYAAWKKAGRLSKP